MNEEVVKLLEPLIRKWPWVLPGLLFLGTLWFCIQGFSSMVKNITGAMRDIAEIKLKDYELAALKKKEPPSKTPAAPKFEPVPLKTWLLAYSLTIFNILAFISGATSEPVTTLKVAVMALNIFGAAWSLATPVFSNLTRTLVYSLREHAWIAQTFSETHVWIAKEQSDFLGKIWIAQANILKTLITQRDILTQKEYLDRVSKQLEEIDRLLNERGETGPNED
jgi:hypothetical protein